MRLLILGDANSIHISNYIKVVLKSYKNCTITIIDFNRREKSNHTVYEYYSLNKINIKSAKKYTNVFYTKFIKKLPLVDKIFNLIQLNKLLKSVGPFDYCIIHYVDIVKVILTLLNRKKYKYIVPVFWGSDILRNPKINNKLYREIFSISNKLIFNTENMQKQFQAYYGHEFKNKSIVIKFPTTSFTVLDQIKHQEKNKQKNYEYLLPIDKYIVMCGHSGNRTEQHIELIENISKSKNTILDKCFFLFPMTYGEKGLINYQQQIKEKLIQYKLDGLILTEYISNRELLTIINKTHIYINTVKTDAFSAVMQENLYTESYVIYGRWLNYMEFSTYDILAKPINHINEVSVALEEAIQNYHNLLPELKRNAQKIKLISSPEKIEEKWRNQVFNK